MNTVNVFFFARLREALATDRLTLTLEEGSTAADLLQQLASRGGAWGQLTDGPPVMIAVNQTMARPATLLRDLDEVALFPPVTGG
jgi:molybdopterin synthase sulfur carrier subunit